MGDREIIEEAAGRLARARRVTVLTGAGVSAESGIPTFRGRGGLWKGRDPTGLATPEAFRSDPAAVWEWYDWRRGIVAAAEPNAAHRALADIEERSGEFLLVTQNVDGLHRQAGSRRIAELHGCLWRLRCTREGRVVEDRTVPIDPIPPVCGCGALLRPDVVWFGETLPLDALESAIEHARACDVMLIVGTTGLVHPAASVPLLARESGAWILEVNPEPSLLTCVANRSLRRRAGEVLPGLVKAAIAGMAA